MDDMQVLRGIGNQPFRLRNVSCFRKDQSPSFLSRDMDTFIGRHGRRPRVLVADFDSRVRTDLERCIAIALSELGFDVDLAPPELPLADVAMLAIENDVHFLFLPTLSHKNRRMGLSADALKAAHEAGIQVIVADEIRNWLPACKSEPVALHGQLSDEFGPRLLQITVRKNSAKYYVDGVLRSDRKILARAITLVESSCNIDRKLAVNVVQALLDHTGSALRIGVSGVPGVGKSTFIESFGEMLIKQGHRVAVLAVDPSSLKSGGSIMGDKTRMHRLCGMPQAFVRPSAAGSILGGVADKTRESMVLCEAAGFDVIIVETVGVGQSETAASSMVDFFLVLMLAGAGDEIQGIKKGILEVADAVAINKADGNNIEKAKEARKEYESALSLITPAHHGWRPPVLICSAISCMGLDDIWTTIRDHRGILRAGGALAKKKQQQDISWMWDLIEKGLQERFCKNPNVTRELPRLIKAVTNGERVATEAALELLSIVR